MEGLSSICSGLGTIEEDDNGNPIGYSKGEYCLGTVKFRRKEKKKKRLQFYVPFLFKDNLEMIFLCIY